MDFDKFIEEIKTKISLKSTLDINDIIVMILPDLMTFGVVTSIERDMMKKAEWWFVTFTTLSIPMKSITRILRTEQMTGQEVFTIDGKQHFFSAVDINITKEEPVEPSKKKAKLTLLRKEK